MQQTRVERGLFLPATADTTLETQSHASALVTTSRAKSGQERHTR